MALLVRVRRWLLPALAAVLVVAGLVVGMQHAATPMRQYRDVAYLPDDNPRHRLDIYTPLGAVEAPVVVFMHGGSWAFGDKALVHPDGALGQYTEFLVNQGYAVASVNYTLVGGGTFPVQVQDVKAALGYLRDNAEYFGVDGDRMVMMGDSAGGHLALMVGTSIGDERLSHGEAGQDSGVRAVVSFYGPTDATKYWEDRLASGCDVGVTGPRSSMGTLLGGIDPVDPSNFALARAASPALRATRSAVPSLMLHGTSDCVVAWGQSLRMAQRLDELGVDERLIVVEGIGHSHPDFWNRGDLRRQVLAFLKEHV
jgi:acetyl esterase/lipase